LKNYPNSFHNSVAELIIQDIEYETAIKSKSVELNERFIEKYPRSVYMYKIKPALVNLEYQNAIEKNATETYALFIEKYPDETQTQVVKNRLIDLEFSDAESKNTFESFNLFFEKYQDLSEFYYDTAIKYLEVDIKDYNGYISKYPNSIFSKIIKEKYENSRFEIVSKSYNIKALDGFIKEFPESNKRDQLQERIIEINKDKTGKNIFDLISENKVEVEVEGSDITEVKIRIRKLVPHNINVQISPGTFFVSNNSSSQNMVTRRSKNITLNDNNWHEYSIYAACANRIKDIPGMDDSFIVQPSSNQEELEMLMKVLSKENVSSSVEQAAIWIVTDNADYDDLGILVLRSAYDYYGGSRVIKEYETARAIQICEKAQIYVKGKSIWNDKEAILRGLKDSSLKKWLQNY